MIKNNILLIDSTSDALYIGLITPTGVLHSEGSRTIKKHNSVLLPTVEQMLLNANIELSDIAAIACNCGAGSFTGIRLGVTTANGLAATGEIKLISMNTFDIAAYNVRNDNTITIIDANYGNYYACRGAHDYCNTTTDELKASNDNVIIVDNCNATRLAELRYVLGDKLRVVTHEEFIDNFAHLAMDRYSRGEFSAYLAPLYIKESQAERELAAKSI